MDFQRNAAYHAIVAGICASSGSLSGKLTNTFSDSFSDTNLSGVVLDLFFKVLFIVIMLYFNCAGWSSFVKALQLSESSLTPTVISTATNFFCSAIYGLVLFEELTTFLWWCGSFLVLIGLALIAKEPSPMEEKSK